MWIFQNKEIHSHGDLLPGCISFVYMIHYTNGQCYIGKKVVVTSVKRPPLKGKKRNRRIVTNLPFINYEGSNDTPKDLVIAYKEILYQCRTRIAATYLESALLFHHDAIFNPMYLNKNIGGTLFDNSLDGLLNNGE